MGCEREGGSKLRRNLQSENCHASAFGISFVCDRQIVSRTLPRCAPNSESPYAARRTRRMNLSGNEREKNTPLGTTPHR
jgi:hypothetical protein